MRFHFTPRPTLHLLALLAVAALTGCQSATGSAEAGNTPPAGFTALWSGRDLAGWWGAGTEDPAKYLALPPEELQAKRTASLADIQQHWRVEDGELVNDGHGKFLTSEQHYGDFELLVDYKTVPLADSGIYPRDRKSVV